MTKRIVAITSLDSRGLESPISGHFGRCPWFTIVTLEDGEPIEVKSLPNPAAENHAPGQIPNFIRQTGAEVIMSGGMGRRAVMMFEQWNIEVVTGASGTVAKALQDWKDGLLYGAAPCPEHDHGDHHHHHHHH